MGPSLGKGEQKLLTSEEGLKLSVARTPQPSLWSYLSHRHPVCFWESYPGFIPPPSGSWSILPPPPAQDPAFAQAAETAASPQPELCSTRLPVNIKPVSEHTSFTGFVQINSALVRFKPTHLREE